MNDALFSVETLYPAQTPIAKSNERRVIDALKERYTKVSFDAHRYAFADHVGSSPVFPQRIADFIAMDCWQSSGYALHGHEVKVSRSDWLTELRDPSKAEAFRPFMTYWWLVVSDRRIVRDGELPEGWGLMAVVGHRLRMVTPAPKHTPEPLPTPLLASLLRAVAKTARQS